MLWKGPCFASIKCFIQIDSLGRDCLAKDAVDVDGLSMVDDLSVLLLFVMMQSNVFI